MAMYIQEMTRMLALPQGAALTAPSLRRFSPGATTQWPGRWGIKMRHDRDGANTRTAATVGDAECLVEVQVANIDSEIARPTNPHQGVQIRAIHVKLPAVCVDDVCCRCNRRLKDAVGGGVGDHRARKIVRVGGGFLSGDRPSQYCLGNRTLRPRPSFPPWPHWLDSFHAQRRGMRQTVRFFCPRAA